MRIYHLVQPYFFAHHHFHRRKIEALRKAGFDAWGLAFIPEKTFQQQKAKYKECINDGVMKIIRIGNEKNRNTRLIFFFLIETIIRNGILVHVLRNDPSPLITLRKWPFIRKKIKYIIEYEGDTPFELVYQSAYIEDPRPPIEPPLNIKAAYDRILKEQKEYVRKADGVLLMSYEQIKLWEDRLTVPLRTCWLPSLSDPSRIKFDEKKRQEIRNHLGITDKLVLVYVGNAICKWQRFDKMCSFISNLIKIDSSIWFLAIVRYDDLDLAQESIIRYGLESCTTLQNVSSDEVTNYLSAADIALYLRHVHPMNLVVTSGKLGEYLSAGLQLITTGANAEILNEFIQKKQSGIFIEDSLEIDDRFISEFKKIKARSMDTEWRKWLSLEMTKSFGNENDPFCAYVPFIRDIIEH